MCRGSPAAVTAAPLQQQRQQRPPWPSPARSSPASCKVRGCGGLWDAPSGSLPALVRYSPRYTPVPPPLMHPGSRAAPLPLHPSSGHRCPQSILRCPLASPFRTYLSQSLPSRSSVTGAVPSRSLGLTLSYPGPSLGEASSLAAGESPFPRRAGPGPPRRVMGAAPGPDRLWAQHPPSSRPRPGTGSKEPLKKPGCAQAVGAKTGVREEGLDWS